MNLRRIQNIAKRVTYVTYDGILEPLGRGQVISYLKELSASYNITILSFEKISINESLKNREYTFKELEKSGIHWVPLRYHKSPRYLSKILDISLGTVRLFFLAFKSRPDIIHVRSYIPAIMALPVVKLFRIRFVFDIRGFWIDERKDIEGWSTDAYVYRAGKLVERLLLGAADHVVTLTNVSISELKLMTGGEKDNSTITVIPTCVNHSLFYPASQKPNKPFIIGWVGSVGHLYLLDEIFILFHSLVKGGKDCRLLFINQGQHDIIRNGASQHGIVEKNVVIEELDYSVVRRGIIQMHIGVAFYLPTYSRIATCPTKLAEYLACGVPCYANKGCGDVDDILSRRQVGVTINGHTVGHRELAIDKLLRLIEDPLLSQRCVETSKDIFSLTEGTRRYRLVYEPRS